MTLFEAVIEGLTATVIGMGMVFGVLAILCVVLYFFKYLNPQEKPAPAAAPATAPPASTAPEAAPAAAREEVPFDSGEIIAVISAALSAYGGENAPALAIKSVTPVGSGSSRAWNLAAIRENHRGLY